jgi:hypothetical protein
MCNSLPQSNSKGTLAEMCVTANIHMINACLDTANYIQYRHWMGVHDLTFGVAAIKRFKKIWYEFNVNHVIKYRDSSSPSFRLDQYVSTSTLVCMYEHTNRLGVPCSQYWYIVLEYIHFLPTTFGYISLYFHMNSLSTGVLP